MSAPSRIVPPVRRGYLLSYDDIPLTERPALDHRLCDALEFVNVTYRAVVSIIFNSVPTSGHPGGSISSAWIVQSLLYNTMEYDFSNPQSFDADTLLYAAGHKAMGLYTMLALRNEIVRITHPELLPVDVKHQLRLEDLLGFRRNRTTSTPLFKKYNAKPLDGHPTPATPFVKLATGASGVGVGASFGLALASIDLYSSDPPQIHAIEGEGGLTPGRVAEALAAASTSHLHNATLHIDWNQASIDTNMVCAVGEFEGDYVQWNPVELFRLHDFNVIQVDDGFSHEAVINAQKYAAMHKNTQPTAIVYCTTKGYKYGIEGRKSHGAGHPVCSEAFYNTLAEFEEQCRCCMPRFAGMITEESIEAHTWELLSIVRAQFESHKDKIQMLGDLIVESRRRLHRRRRTMRADAPSLSILYDQSKVKIHEPPEALVAAVGATTTLRQSLADVLGHLNRLTGGGVFGAAADLLGSTSMERCGKDFPAGFFSTIKNPMSRTLSCGGICEDATGAIMTGITVYGHHLTASSSYGAFICALQHIALRLHCIGMFARREALGIPFNTYIMVAAHAGLKTGEDGPTHADPQCLQLVQENFPHGACITLTPWDPNELWPCMIAGLLKRPAVLVPVVSRPIEVIANRAGLGIPPATAAAQGVYMMFSRGEIPHRNCVVLQGAGVTNTFVVDVLPKLRDATFGISVFYVSSVELFDDISEAEQDRIFPEECALQAMAITDFTLPTMYRFIRSCEGRKWSLHAFKNRHFPGSGKAHKVFEEACLDGPSQWNTICRYVNRENESQ